MSVSVIIPFWGYNMDRLDARDWVVKRLVGCGLSGSVIEPPAVNGSMSKGAVIWPAIRRSEADVLVLHDADVWCDGLLQAIEVVSSGQFVWARPHDRVLRLSRAATADFLASDGEIPHPARLQLARPAYRGMTGGGIVVARREVLLDVPIDPRFVGWGQEDTAFGNAIWTLYGPPWIGKPPLIHLWHEPEPRLTQKWGSVENQALYKRYHKATVNPSMMLELVAETHEALSKMEIAI